MSISRRRWHATEISYCSNVHPGERFDDIRNVVTRFVAGVRKARGLDRMSAGLWLGAEVAEYIDGDKRHLKEFSNLLNECGIDLVTLNGFPFGGFHQASVKERVYSPAWNEQRRVNYTLRLARILACNLANTEHEGTISTIPVAYRRGWSLADQQAAAHNLCQLAATLHELQLKTGKNIRVCLEMEPGCVLESTDEVLRFFGEDLAHAADRSNIDPQWISKHLCICYDICHQAVMFENPADSLAKLNNAGISVGKIQISSAMHVEQPGAADTILGEFAEPKYLHQVRTLNSNRELYGAEDLDTALSDGTLSRDQPWRIHFHLPIQSTSLHCDLLQTTQNEIRKVFDYLQQNTDFHPHLEVETYTWQVLPEQLRPANAAELINGLKDELDWVENELRQRDLLESVQPIGS